MIRLLVPLMILAGAAQAAERPLSGDEITALLPTITALGDKTKQTFDADGKTVYIDNGRATFGTWWTSGDQYCSNWPPAGGHACYDVLLDEQDSGDTNLIWIGDSGRRFVDLIMPKE